MTDSDDHRVPPVDISYAVENALWVARSAVTTRTSTALDYLGIFERQLTTHYDCLLALHGGGEGEPEPRDDLTMQQSLDAYADGGPE